MIDVDLSGYFYGARAAAGAMSATGVIINVSSIAGLRPDGPNLAHYTAAKAGVIGLTKALAVELGPRGHRSVVSSRPTTSRASRSSPPAISPRQ